MFNQNTWHAEKGTFRAVTGGPYRLFGAYGLIIYGSSFPARGTIPVSSPKAGTIISQGVMVRGTGTTFKADVQEEDYLHAKNVVRKVRNVISDTLLELEGGFPTDIASPGENLRVCRPQVYNAIYAKSTGSADATALQEAPFKQNDTLLNGGAPLSYDATAGEIDFTLSR
jgi:hypothetical protein